MAVPGQPEIRRTISTEEAAAERDMTFDEIADKYNDYMKRQDEAWRRKTAVEEAKREQAHKPPKYADKPAYMRALVAANKRAANKWLREHGMLSSTSKRPKPTPKPKPTPAPDTPKPEPPPAPDNPNPTPAPAPDNPHPQPHPTPPAPDNPNPTPAPAPDNPRPTPTLDRLRSTLTDSFKPFHSSQGGGGMDKRAAALITIVVAVTFIFMYDTGIFRVMMLEMRAGG